MAQHSKSKWRQDLIFTDTGIHLSLKWIEAIQDRLSHLRVQLPQLRNPLLSVQICWIPVPLPSPSYTLPFPPFPILKPPFRYALKKILIQLHIPLAGHGSDFSKRSRGTLAFDNSISLQNIIVHGLWRSYSVCYYLQQASLAPCIVPHTFTSIILPFL